MKYLVFGAGRFGKALGKYILEKTQDELIAYLDRDESKTELSFENVTVPVYRPSELGKVNFDIVMISVDEATRDEKAAFRSGDIRRPDQGLYGGQEIINCSIFKL